MDRQTVVYWNFLRSWDSNFCLMLDDCLQDKPSNSRVIIGLATRLTCCLEDKLIDK